MPVSQDAMTIARNATFTDRIRYHLTKSAVDVMAEIPGEEPGAAEIHAARVAYANEILDGTADFSSAAIAVLTNPTIAAAIDLESADFGVADGDLPFTVNSLYNALARISL